MENKKPLRIFVAIVAIFALLCAAGFAVFYFYADAIRFDYCDTTTYLVDENSEQLERDGYGLTVPFFGNSMTLSEHGSAKHYIFGIGQNNEPVYSAVNDVLGVYALRMTDAYKNRIKSDYEVINNGKTLTVIITGLAYPDSIDGEAVGINKTFTFDIENAGLSKLPQLI